jgi:hypothetical protein
MGNTVQYFDDIIVLFPFGRRVEEQMFVTRHANNSSSHFTDLRGQSHAFGGELLISCRQKCRASLSPNRSRQ